MNTQNCGTCLKDKPISSFAKNKTKKFGISTKCKECHKGYLMLNKNPRSTQPQECHTCSSMLPSDHFYTSANNTTGLANVCRACSAATAVPYVQDTTRKSRIIRNRAFVNRYKVYCGCSLCGNKSGLNLVFKDTRATGKPSIRYNWGRKRIKTEIRRCYILCSKCKRR